MKNLLPAIVFALLGLGFLVSSHFPPWYSWQNEALSFAAALLLAWDLILKSKQQKNVVLDVPRMALVPLVLVLLAGLQWASGMLIFGGEVVVIFFYAMLCSLCVSIGFSQGFPVHTDGSDLTTPLADALAWTLLLAAMATAFILLVQNFMLDAQALWVTNTDNYTRPGSHLGQTNHAATLQILGMVSALFLQTRGRFSHFTVAPLLLLFGIGMAVTQSRTSVLSLGALLLWWAWKQPQIAPRTSRWAGVAIGTGIVTLFMSWPKLFNWVHIMGSGEGAQVRGLSDVRSQVWQQLAHAMWQKPWLGWGINQTASAHNAIAGDYPPTAAFTYSHNLLLDMALWVGLPLTAFLALLTAVWLWRRTRAVRTPLPWLGLALALPVAVHSMLEYPFAYAYFLVPAMLGLGLTEGALGGRSLRLPLKPALAILMTSTLLMAWSAVEYLRAEEDYRVVRFEVLEVGQTPAAYQPPKMLLLTQVGALLNSLRLPLAPHMSAADLTLLHTVTMHYPLPGVAYRYALALALNGQRTEALRQLAVLRAQHGEEVYRPLCQNVAAQLQEYKLEQLDDCSSDMMTPLLPNP